MDKYELRALEIAKEITVSKVAGAGASHTKDVGEGIGEMFTAIYKAVLENCKPTQDASR